MPFGNFKGYKTNKKGVYVPPKKQVTKTRNIVKSMLKKMIEMKQYTAGLGVQPVWGAAAGVTFTLLTNIGQGVSDNQRVGDTIKLKHISIRLGVYNNYGAGSVPSNTFRVIIFQYNNTDAAPSATQMMLNGAGAGQVNAYSHYNRDYKKKYHVLTDRMYNTVGTIGAATQLPSNYCRFIKFKVPLKYAKSNIQYLAAGNNAENGIYFCVLGESATVAANPFYQLDFQTHYTDA